MNNDPIVTQMQSFLSQRGYTLPTSSPISDISSSSNGDWFAKTAPPVTPTPTPQESTGVPAIVDIAKGGIKGAVQGFQDIGNTFLPKTAPFNNPANPNAKMGIDENKLAPTNKEQAVGHMLGEAVPYLVGPETLVPKVATEIAVKEAPKIASVSSDFIKSLITPDLSTKATVDAIKTGKVTEGSGLTGTRDITQAVPNIDKMQSAVSEVPNLSEKATNLENVNAIHDHIGTVAQDLRTQLQNVQTQTGSDRGFFTPNEFKNVMNNAKQTLSENPTLVGDSEKTASKILDKFSSLVKEKGYTPTGLLDARQALDNWVSTQKGENIFDPKTESALSTALKVIRQGGNDFLASKVPSVAVKDLLSKQNMLYNAIDNIAPKAGKEGDTAYQQFVKAHPTAATATKTALAWMGLAAVGGLTASHFLGQ